MPKRESSTFKLGNRSEGMSRGGGPLCEIGKATAKKLFKVYPSAYANGYAVQVCRGTKPDYLGNYQDHYAETTPPSDSNLARWYRERWVNVCQRDSRGRFIPCGRKEASLASSTYPYCRPLYKLPKTPVKSVGQLTQAELKKMCTKKKRVKHPSRITLEGTL